MSLNVVLGITWIMIKIESLKKKKEAVEIHNFKCCSWHQLEPWLRLKVKKKKWNGKHCNGKSVEIARHFSIAQNRPKLLIFYWDTRLSALLSKLVDIYRIKNFFVERKSSQGLYYVPLHFIIIFDKKMKLVDLKGNYTGIDMEQYNE